MRRDLPAIANGPLAQGASRGWRRATVDHHARCGSPSGSPAGPAGTRAASLRDLKELKSSSTSDLNCLTLEVVPTHTARVSVQPEAEPGHDATDDQTVRYRFIVSPGLDPVEHVVKRNEQRRKAKPTVLLKAKMTMLM